MWTKKHGSNHVWVDFRNTARALGKKPRAFRCWALLGPMMSSATLAALAGVEGVSRKTKTNRINLSGTGRRLSLAQSAWSHRFTMTLRANRRKQAASTSIPEQQTRPGSTY
jgi:hypothetical protein